MLLNSLDMRRTLVNRDVWKEEKTKSRKVKKNHRR
jgi:hypothetical protein